jgi:20S proteasome alpha/beta subunit
MNVPGAVLHVLLFFMVCTPTLAAKFSSPVPHLEASLAASTAHSTVVALCCDDDCVILVSRSPKHDTSSALLPPRIEADLMERYGLTVCAGTAAKKWHQWTPTTLGTMTGFAADSQHLLGVVRRQVESHQTLYTEPQPIAKTVRTLATLMQRTALREGSRPFGVSALLVGYVPGGWQTYTVDPTGSWRVAAAIGRHADKVQEELNNKSRTGKETSSISAKEGLELAIAAILKGAAKANEQIDSDSYEAHLVWMDSNKTCCQISRITSASVKDCYESCLKQISN